MEYLFLIAMFTVVTTISYFVIKDGNQQLNDDDDDPTITCWDDDKVHTEGNF